MASVASASSLTGRIASGPDDLYRAEVLQPQLDYELRALLPWYVREEKVLLAEYRRLGLLDGAEVAALAGALNALDADELIRCAGESMADVAFSLERAVSQRLGTVPARWHVDRSRNDLQAGAQMLAGRDAIVEVAEGLLACGRVALRRAAESVNVSMPGYTHQQPAQVISAGFYLSAVSDCIVQTLDRLEAAYAAADRCPLGAGAMAGQELDWDRSRMARLLGCGAVREHALTAVAGRDWALTATAEFSLWGVAVSRFVTDLMTWAGAGYGFVDWPDNWAGISSAMPQKRNFPVLERIRARTAHLTAGHLAVVLGQRSTPYSNSVEVSKEAGAQLPATFAAMLSTLRLFTAVLENVRWHPDRTRAACAAEYLGGFTLANLLTLHADVPWRTAQVLAGQYVVAASDAGLSPDRPDGDLLTRLAADRGLAVGDAGALLAEAFALDGALATKRTSGSTHPDAVRAMLAGQEVHLDRAERWWQQRRERIAAGLAELDATLVADEPPGADR
ncbi:lyase family protein [Micromonospora sp. NPDC051296]|uniref:argininosuccinate lyase n=1 Tax=Micromonospora sp. NPDC051296 TaxID=3155046 RepID=UPI0034141962